ncbi:MAG: Multi-sensor signal transduction histidine kinase [Candidatus Wolfebacteria bacterium GW2011_GWC1_37_10]|uniref:histidine kinase n=1 Tax=Candidatus Wolfebacteria bacterium GW2011_GWC1_37_10 TaxID=1619010 RepID=A0A0G0FVQ5_9BACT|nr:MAG: Multi-sensor signal transduction histidine kinase [Candidatus Wolfebacteria bacterium GW2011_GWC1_37_10]
MRLFWFFLVLSIIVSVLVIFYLPLILALIPVSIFFVLDVVVFNSIVKLAELNFQVKIERNQLNNVISTLRDGVIAYDENIKILVFNPSAESIFNLKTEEVLGKDLNPEQIKEPRLKILIQTLFPSLASTVIRHSEAGSYPQIMDISFEDEGLELRTITNRITDLKGNLLGFVKSVSNRTREVELLRSKNEFISVAAHQLRTPLTGLYWAFETLAKENLKEDQKQIVTTGLEASSFLLKIVNDLLDVSKIEEGRFGYNFEKINLIEFIETVIKELKSLADEAGVKIYFQKPEEPLEINGDSQKLGMALFNLIDNAIRYNVKNGEVVLAVEKLKDKPYLQISVKDTGIGVPPEVTKKIFTKFFRADNAMKIAPNGSGLGLYIVKNIIKRHGGEIWVESELNRGSTFYFIIPLDSSLIPQKEFIYEEE